MNRLSIVGTLIVAASLVVFGVAVATNDPTSAAQPHLTDMQASAAALTDAGATMQRHGQTMLDEGRSSRDQELVGHGEHWLADGAALTQRGEWLAMSPTDPGSLLASPAELQQNGSWTELSRRTAQMLHDPAGASSLDLAALRLNGAAMQAEGRLMIEHGRQMVDEVELMVLRHSLDTTAANELQTATAAMLATGEHLERNGAAMIDYADDIARTIGK